MARAFIVVVGLIALLSACTQRLACPAYQSSFIYDKETLRKKFSYFKEDSTPKIYTASKSKYLIAVPESYRKKYRKMQTVEMKPIYPVIPDSLKVDKDADMLLAERDVIDSATTARRIEPGDSAYAITKTKEKFNLDQDLYMWYFRDMLVLPDVRAAMQKNSEKKEDAKTSATKVKKEKVGFFRGLKNIFKKKEKKDTTGATVTTPPKKETTDVNNPEQKPKKKRGLFRKKDKTADPAEIKEPDPKKKEDGF
ncbi:hypothetical protein BH10BAC4_BH10BAC4_19330 [soil metagenome]